MSNEQSLMESFDNLAADDAFSGGVSAEDNGKQNDETTSAKKTVKKKAEKVTAKPVKVDKPDADPASAKKASPKKANEVKAETVEPKPVKVKRAAKKTESKEQAESEQKPKIRKQTAAGKEQLVEDNTPPKEQDTNIITPASGQHLLGEETITAMPLTGIYMQESISTAEEEQTSIDTQSAYWPETDVASAAEEPEIEPIAELYEKEQFQIEGTEEIREQSEAVTKLPIEEKPVTEEQSLNAEPEIISTDTDPSISAKSALRKITFQIKFHTREGQSLYVAGNHPLLGNNAAENAFPLNYINQEYWSGSLEIPAGQELFEAISYNYILKSNNITVVEWGEDKVIHPSQLTKREILLADSWNNSSFVENTFYTEPFQQVLLKDNFTEAETKTPELITHTFKVKAPLLAKGQALCIIGSIPELEEWNTENPSLLSRKEEEVWFTISLDLSNAAFPFAYKYGVSDVNTGKFLRYEDGQNRVLYNDVSPDRLTIVSDGFVHLSYNSFKGTGVAIPVFSLKSENSFGVGEFTDLNLLVDWSKEVGLKLIQILPVNDTTATHTFTDSYPYAAISAFALHPLYLHLPSLVDNKNNSLVSSFQEKQNELNSQSEVDYVGVMAAKWSFIKQVFPIQKQQVFQSNNFSAFFKENAHWLIPYAAFCYFREKYNTPDFSQWATNQIYNAEQINQLASSPIDADEEISIYFFVQFHLHLQLQEATNYAHQNGIILKGDIPIGIYRYSCDAWQEPLLYNMDMQAGAPPDNFAVKGQNWGFPTYNWQRMREDGFVWWKNRFKQMSYYFDAFRIDHILGFFRIWSIPMNAVEGIMGHFVPAVPVYIIEFTERGIGFNYERLCKPYINDSVLSAVLGNDREMITGKFIEISADGNYSFKAEFDTQRKIEKYFSDLEETDQNKRIKSALFDLLSNVILFEAEGSEGKEFHFRIAMDNTLSFKHLDGYIQYQLKELYLNYFYRRQDDFWMKEAMQKLPELKRSTNMLICGEDLGMVPDCVPGVMKELAILSLEIQRMPKDPTLQFFHPDNAPYLSVVTPSTHDMSTVRGWWEEDRAATQSFFIKELGQWGTAPYFCETWINKIIVQQHLYSPAMWCIFQLQDLLGINFSIRRENPHEERINIPSNPRHYWRYRMHLTLESLIKESQFTSELKNLVVQSGR